MRLTSKQLLLKASSAALYPAFGLVALLLMFFWDEAALAGAEKLSRSIMLSEAFAIGITVLLLVSRSAWKDKKTSREHPILSSIWRSVSLIFMWALLLVSVYMSFGASLGVLAVLLAAYRVLSILEIDHIDEVGIRYVCLGAECIVLAVLFQELSRPLGFTYSALIYCFAVGLIEGVALLLIDRLPSK